jgi:hypothetical protein
MQKCTYAKYIARVQLKQRDSDSGLGGESEATAHTTTLPRHKTISHAQHRTTVQVFSQQNTGIVRTDIELLLNLVHHGLLPADPWEEAYVGTYTHSCMHACIHTTYIQTYIYTSTRVHNIHMRIQIHINTRIRNIHMHS